LEPKKKKKRANKNKGVRAQTEVTSETEKAGSNGAEIDTSTSLHVLNDDEWLAQSQAAGIPRTSPVAVAVIPTSAVSPNADVHTKLGRDTCTYSAVMQTTYAQSADCLNGELPSMMCKYTVPINSDSNLIDPFPLSKYRTEYTRADFDAGNVSEVTKQTHDAVWKSYGNMVVCADQIQRNTECYVLKTRILIEFRGTRDIYLDPPTPIANAAGVTHSGNRRLDEWSASPSIDTSAMEGQLNNSNIVENAPGDSSMNQLISSNTGLISVNTQRVAALELLAGKLKTHAGTLSFDQHVLDPTHTLHGRIMTNETDVQTIQDLLSPPLWEPLSALSWSDGGLQLVGTSNNILRSGCTGSGSNYWQTASIAVKHYGNQVYHVMLRGNVTLPSSASGGLMIMSVPTPFRPAKNVYFSCAAQSSNNALINVQCLNYGPVYATSIDPSPDDRDLFLDGISWWTN
jgi:hypothetical protein